MSNNPTKDVSLLCSFEATILMLMTPELKEVPPEVSDQDDGRQTDEERNFISISHNYLQ